jgi:sugar phosphate isomerase/epimerase
LEIKYFKSTWGMTEGSLEENLKSISEAGYDGVEAGAPEERKARDEMADLLDKYRLLFVGQQWTDGINIEEHKKSFERQLKNNLELKPVQINSHTGRDYYDESKNSELIRYCNSMAGALGVKLTHETHRGRFSFCLVNTVNYIGDIPDLRLTADFSHWCCVSESLLEGQTDLMDRVFPRCDQIHARIGHEEGPQVSDPRAPEWEYAVSKHLDWWTRIVALHEMAHTEMLPITVEFGPPNYMMTAPYSKKPVADLWELNLYMRELLKKNLILKESK